MLSAVIFGSSFIAVGRTIDTYIIRTIDPKVYAIMSNLFIGLFLLAFALYRRQGKEIPVVLKERPKTIMLAGLVNGWGYLALLIAISILEVTVAEPASLLSVFVTAFLAKRFLNENISERIPGTIFMVLGALILLIQW